MLECQVFGFRFVSSHASKAQDIPRLVKKTCRVGCRRRRRSLKAGVPPAVAKADLHCTTHNDYGHSERGGPMAGSDKYYDGIWAEVEQSSGFGACERRRSQPWLDSVPCSWRNPRTTD